MILLLVLTSSVDAAEWNQESRPTAQKQKLAEQTADRLMKRFYETLQFTTIWREFYVTNPALRNLEIEAVMSNLVRYRADELRETRISMAAIERAYIAMHDFWATLSAASFTSGKVPSDIQFRRMYESITQRPRPYANSAELDQDFTHVINRLSEANRKLVSTENVGSNSYMERLNRFVETSPADSENMNDVFAPAGLPRSTIVYKVRREMFHIYMIEEKGEFKVLTILNRFRL